MKKIVIGAVIIGIIILAVILGKDTNTQENKENTNTFFNNNQNTNENIVENILENVLEQNIINDVVNELSPTETFEEEPKTEEEKAIEIVKKDWNENISNVKYTVEGINENGGYIIAVRDKDTTKALAFYTVNVKDKTFTKREMN